MPYTLLFLETPHRLIESLSDLESVLGPRQMAACRELTKLYEEIRRGTISEVIAHFNENQPRGEFVLVIAGKGPSEPPSAWDESALIAAIQSELQNGKPAKQISAELAEKSGWPKKEIYALVSGLK